MNSFRTISAIFLMVCCGRVLADDKVPDEPPPPMKQWPAGSGVKEWKDTDFVHPPLQAHELYKRMHEYPISAWCFHGVRNQSPYGEKYVRDFKAVGFNVMIDDPKIIPYAEKVGGVWVQIGETRTIFGKSPQYLEDYVFKGKTGDHPLLQGIILGDNARSVGGNAVRVASWLKKDHPHVAPILSVYPCRFPGNTDLRIIHRQNYAIMRSSPNYATSHYLDLCNSDRVSANNQKLAMWQCYTGDASHSRIQFQTIGAMAYGAQGLSNFCYSPHRMAMYKPDSPMIPVWHKMHQYLIHVLGRHVWGLRSIDVLHSAHGGAHRGALMYAADQLVLRGSEFTMVGLLTPEAKFYSENPADREIPEYFMLVDKRTSGGQTPPARAVSIMISPKVSAVELIDANATKDAKIRQIVPAFKGRVSTEGGYGVLLRVAPDMETLLGGPEGMKLYAKINTALAALQAKATPPAPTAGKASTIREDATGKPESELPLVKVDAAEVDKTLAAAKTDAAELAKVLDAAVAAGKISKDQAADTLKRLAEAMDAAAAEAKDPKPSAA